MTEERLSNPILTKYVHFALEHLPDKQQYFCLKCYLLTCSRRMHQDRNNFNRVEKCDVVSNVASFVGNPVGIVSILKLKYR